MQRKLTSTYTPRMTALVIQLNRSVRNLNETSDDTTIRNIKKMVVV